MDEFLSKPLDRRRSAVPGVARKFREERLVACRSCAMLVEGLKCLIPFLTEMEKMFVWDFYGLGGCGYLSVKEIAERMQVKEHAVIKVGVGVTKRVIRGLKLDAHYVALLGRDKVGRRRVGRPKKMGRPKKRKSAAKVCAVRGSQE